MHVPPQLDPMERALAERLPHLRGPQRRGLALRVLSAVLAQSACQVRPAVPPGWTVLVPADRGLWSPRLWRRIRRLGWHPLLRTVQPPPHAAFDRLLGLGLTLEPATYQMLVDRS